MLAITAKKGKCVSFIYAKNCSPCRQSPLDRLFSLASLAYQLGPEDLQKIGKVKIQIPSSSLCAVQRNGRAKPFIRFRALFLIILNIKIKYKFEYFIAIVVYCERFGGVLRGRKNCGTSFYFINNSMKCLYEFQYINGWSK